MGIVGAIAVPHPPLIVPDVGRGEEARIQATIDAYRQATRALLDLRPDAIVVTSPHAPLFRDAFHITTDAALDGDMARFRAPGARLHARCDVQLAREILLRANEAGIVAVGSDRYRDDMDHGTYVPLHFVREAYRARLTEGQTATGPASDPDDLPCPIVRIGLSGLSPQTHAALGRVIAEAADALGLCVGFIASGDLSHKLLPEGPYGFAPEGPVFDERIGEVFASGALEALFDFDEDFCEAAAECGLRSFQIMAGAIEGLGFESHLLSNEGPFGVGYGVATFLPRNGREDAACDPHIALARLSVETFVTTGAQAKLPDDVPNTLLSRRAGVFVSLHEHGELRGCIGTIGPTEPSIAEEVLRNGVLACSEDPRFPPVRPDELDFLDYSVDVLGEAVPIDTPAQLDPKRYGVIVTKGWKRGLLLPNLEGVDTVDYQLAIAKRKAGIDPADDDVQLERFEVVRHTRGGKPRKG
ncbi:MAG TPA: extradiol ring-cleavage dioxygenase [Eggerthellaceae bacterium]|nr:extradiol ring-cleavage dioxygenase [Eggerthellaceae bacterium]